MNQRVKKPPMYDRRLPIWAIIVIDILVLAISLLTFAYFHHVQQKSFPSEGLITDTDDQFGEGMAKFANITVEERSYGEGDNLVTYYFADIYISDIKYLQTCLAGPETGGTEAYGNYQDTIFNMAERSNAVIAINGDFYGFQKSGLVIRDGVIHGAKSTRRDVCVLYYDGTMKTYRDGNYPSEEYLVENGAYQAWTFGPSLLDDEGKARDDLDTIKRYEGIYGDNPRAVIGYYEPGHYCFVIVDGRQSHSVGTDLTELAELMEDLGCSVAYNLDGGRTAMMVYDGEYVNKPHDGGRKVSDIILIAEGGNVNVTFKKND